VVSDLKNDSWFYKLQKPLFILLAIFTPLEILLRGLGNVYSFTLEDISNIILLIFGIVECFIFGIYGFKMVSMMKIMPEFSGAAAMRNAKARVKRKQIKH